MKIFGLVVALASLQLLGPPVVQAKEITMNLPYDDILILPSVLHAYAPFSEEDIEKGVKFSGDRICKALGFRELTGTLTVKPHYEPQVHEVKGAGKPDVVFIDQASVGTITKWVAYYKRDTRDKDSEPPFFEKYSKPLLRAGFISTSYLLGSQIYRYFIADDPNYPKSWAEASADFVAGAATLGGIKALRASLYSSILDDFSSDRLNQLYRAMLYGHKIPLAAYDLGSISLPESEGSGKVPHLVGRPRCTGKHHELENYLWYNKWKYSRRVKSVDSKSNDGALPTPTPTPIPTLALTPTLNPTLYKDMNSDAGDEKGIRDDNQDGLVSRKASAKASKMSLNEKVLELLKLADLVEDPDFDANADDDNEPDSKRGFGKASRLSPDSAQFVRKVLAGRVKKISEKRLLAVLQELGIELSTENNKLHAKYGRESITIHNSQYSNETHRHKTVALVKDFFEKIGLRD